ncbi:MAG TPA: hypothetical protein VHE55_11130 [Fimbriimonadaceae bacterium]|nr:hypothetical protein [Fimbriimonadaceae bacterium]
MSADALMWDQYRKAEEGKLQIEWKDQPTWARKLLRRVESFLELQRDWDGYGAAPIDPILAAHALQVLADFASNDCPEPSVVPTTSGGVQVEWHVYGIDFEFEILPDCYLALYGNDRRTGREFEPESTADRASVKSWIDELARRNQQCLVNS